MEWYVKVLKNYFVFSGRARRKEYWMFGLINLVITVVLNLVDLGIGTLDATTGYGLFSGIYTLAVFIPSIAVSVRRLHDTNHSGWWLFLALIPLIGVLFLLVVFCFDSKEDNEYGPNPKAINEPDTHFAS
ncbi:DUF805 domain-containing protein [Shewanella aestuarii]|uniref:DUF805 domain-containing protein n=1 Tax=Shewanella aestuarii TaxID=1028752 RepID=A0A6G9QKX2_9GAMM|nr:DUF805 domain-containing protein [Shewanella aestuarii]QIR14707.1 DUF805 domain-containing protein [Shewanella aestuarii]